MIMATVTRKPRMQGRPHLARLNGDPVEIGGERHGSS
jgi:hypothetical protein